MPSIATLTTSTLMNESKPLQIQAALKLLRIFHDFQQKELAKKLGISKSYISELESAKKTPTTKLLERYAEVLDIPVSSIVFLAENIDVNNSSQIQNFVCPKIIILIRFIAERSCK